MKNDNVFDILVVIVFDMIPQLGCIGHKYQDLVTPFQLKKGESLPYFHLWDFQARSKIYLLNDKIRYKKNHR